MLLPDYVHDPLRLDTETNDMRSARGWEAAWYSYKQERNIQVLKHFAVEILYPNDINRNDWE